MMNFCSRVAIFILALGLSHCMIDIYVLGAPNKFRSDTSRETSDNRSTNAKRKTQSPSQYRNSIAQTLRTVDTQKLDVERGLGKTEHTQQQTKRPHWSKETINNKESFDEDDTPVEIEQYVESPCVRLYKIGSFTFSINHSFLCPILQFFRRMKVKGNDNGNTHEPIEVMYPSKTPGYIEHI